MQLLLGATLIDGTGAAPVPDAQYSSMTDALAL
jgi:hypothetical protein